MNTEKDFLARISHRVTTAAGIAIAMGLLLTGGCASQAHGPATGTVPVIADPPLTRSPEAPRTPAAPIEAQAVSQPMVDTTHLRGDAPGEYIVKKGDTLWDISARFLADPWYWPELWHANPNIRNPHLIYPGDVISLYYVNGQPRLGINRTPSGSARLKPRVRTTTLDGDNSGIPINALRPFLIRPQIIAEEQLKAAPHILGSSEHRLIYGAGDRVYVRNLHDNAVGKRYSVFRPGEVLRDPVTHEKLGYQALYAGDATVEASGQPTTVTLHKTVREVLRGDRLLPLDSGATGMHFWPHAPTQPVDGRVVGLFDVIDQAAQYQPVALNVGKRNGVEPGHVFVIEQQGVVVRDLYHGKDQSTEVELPTETTGLAMVFRTFDKISYALIMKSTRPVRIGDLVRRP